jgi:hypothetical protein
MGRLIESLFPPGWLSTPNASHANHLGWQAWRLASDIAARQGLIRWPDDLELFPKIAALMLDGWFLAECSGGNIQSLTAGTFSNYGDEKVRRRLAAVVLTSEGFPSVMTELSYAAWHLSKSHRVTAFEDPGVADFRIDIPEFDLPIIADCKRIAWGTKVSRMSKVINAANKQIKAVAIPCYGIVAVDVADKVSNPKEVSDEIPSTVQELIDEAQSAVAHSNSSVSGVLLIWNDFVRMGEPGVDPRSLVVLRRRSVLVEHKNPVRRLPKDRSSILVGNTITHWITWQRQLAYTGWVSSNTLG